MVEEVVIVRVRQVVASAAVAVLAGAGLAVSTGIAPAAAATCAGTAPSDFNGDGISDAAIGQPDPFNVHDGFVHIIYGRRSGLSADAHGSALDDQLLSAAGASFTFGKALAAGDFNGDGCTDLAVGDGPERSAVRCRRVPYTSSTGQRSVWWTPGSR